MSSILENNEDNNEKNENKKITLIKVNATQVNFKGIPPKKIKKEIRNDRNYDFLCWKFDEKIVQSLDDEYYN